MDRKVRRGLIERDHPDLSVGKQCGLLSLSRSSFYYEAKGETDLNLDLMRRIDKQFLETPFYGVGQMTVASEERGPSRQREAHPAVDAPHGANADLPEAQHQQGGQGA